MRSPRRASARREARCFVERLTAARPNIRLATIAPPMHPPNCAGTYAAAFLQDTPPNAASTRETTGLKWAPETGPNIKMMANKPAAVAAAFSKSSKPTSPGERCCAAIPDPMTMAARNPEPRNSAASRRRSDPGATEDRPCSFRSAQAEAGAELVASSEPTLLGAQQALSPLGAQQAPSPCRPLSTGASARTV